MRTIQMTWEEICAEPTLQDLPFKIEQDGFGRILMSPVRRGHARRQAAIGVLLARLLPRWEILMEMGVTCAEGVRVPDLSALRPERAGGDSDEIALDQAPDICIEVTSPRNTTEEMTEKRRLLAGAGCREFWLCFDDGRMLFLDAVSGDPLDRSGLCPEFPTRTDIA